MGTVQLYGGAPLLVDSSVAIAPECCCGPTYSPLACSHPSGSFTMTRPRVIVINMGAFASNSTSCMIGGVTPCQPNDDCPGGAPVPGYRTGTGCNEVVAGKIAPIGAFCDALAGPHEIFNEADCSYSVSGVAGNPCGKAYEWLVCPRDGYVGTGISDISDTPVYGIGLYLYPSNPGMIGWRWRLDVAVLMQLNTSFSFTAQYTADDAWPLVGGIYQAQGTWNLSKDLGGTRCDHPDDITQ